MHIVDFNAFYIGCVKKNRENDTESLIYDVDQYITDCCG